MNRKTLAIGIAIIGFIGVVALVIANSSVTATIEQIDRDNVGDLSAIVSTCNSDITCIQARTRLALEKATLLSRRTIAESTLALQMWIRFVTHICGFTISLIGAIFVVSRIHDSPSRAEATLAHNVRVELATSSPGFVLILLGGVMLVSPLLADRRLDVTDAPIYLGTPTPIPDPGF